MKTPILPSDAETSKRLSPLPASKTVILDARVLAFQQFLMDRFSASMGASPPSLYHTSNTLILNEELISSGARLADEA